MSGRRHGSVRCWATRSGCWSTPARRRCRDSRPSRSSTSSWRCPTPADEPAYVPELEAGGYVLRGREPDWFEHRLFNGPDPAVNLHVFSAGSPEIDRTLAFRDRLRTDEDDRRLYEATKRELAARDWVYVQDYADAKDEVVAAIVARAWPSGLTAAPALTSSAPVDTVRART